MICCPVVVLAFELPHYNLPHDRNKMSVSGKGKLEGVSVNNIGSIGSSLASGAFSTKRSLDAACPFGFD